MLKLLRKEALVTRWVHLAGLVVGLGMVPVLLEEPDAGIFFTLFAQLMYTHLVFTQCRLSAANRPDNLLLNSLPVTRRDIVYAKYLYLLISAVVSAAYFCAVVCAASLLGVPVLVPLPLLFALLALLGMLYHLVLLPLSYLDARYGSWASMVVYLSILLLPRVLGKNAAGAGVVAAFAQAAQWLGRGGIQVLLVALVLGLAALSAAISQAIYARAEF